MSYILLLIQQFIASTTHLVVKSATSEIDPRMVVLLRGCIAVGAYGIWLALNRSKIFRIERKDIPRLLLLGIINIPVNQLAFISGMKFTTPPNAALLYALTPAFVFVIAILFYGEKATPKKIAGILIALIGTGIVLFEKGLDFGSQYFWGNVLVFTASFSWALYTVLGRSFAIKYGAIYATALSMLTGLFFYIPVMLCFDLTSSPADLTLPQWGLIAYMGIVTSAVAYALWYLALSRIEASKVAVFNNIQPVLTTLLTIFFFGTHPSPIFIVGGVIAIIGVYVTQKG